MFRGVLTALITPMREGRVDEGNLRKLVEDQIAAGVSGLVPCGTTGETPTLSDDERAKVIRTTVEAAKGRVPVVAGAGANSTAKAIDLGRMAAECGATGLLHVTPYYNKPSQAGLLAHFRAIADASSLPVVLYNVPGRTASDLLPETIAELAKHRRVVAVKEASGNVLRTSEILAAVPQFCVLSGDDALTLPLISLGAQGVIAVVSNVAPKQMVSIVSAALSGDFEAARIAHNRLRVLMGLMFVDSNPVPVKAAAALLGYTANEVRLPLVPLADAHKETIAAELKQLGILR